MPQLTWLGDSQAKQQYRRVPYHLLQTVSLHGAVDSSNLLIQGDNLLALKALLPFYAGQVKCIFIDPPYNTQSAFEHYDDNLEHSQWLSMMYPRLELLKALLADDGFIIVHIDDAEGHYLKIMLDELFARSNYQTSIYIQVRYASKTLKSDMDYHKQIEQAFIYRKGATAKPNREIIKDEGYKKFCFGIKELSAGREIFLGGKKVKIFQSDEYKVEKVTGFIDGLKEIWASGSILDGNSSGRFFRDYLTGRTTEDGLGVLYKVSGIGDDGLGYRYFSGPKKTTATKGKYYQGVPIEKRIEGESVTAQPIENFLDLSGQFGNCRSEGDVDFRSGKKPEQYLKKILEYFTQPGDLVLDSFLGSGTTAAVAHKMGRRWIGIEMGEHAQTHCLPRLQKVIEGDASGISGALNWQGGGGFRFCTLGQPVFLADGQINPQIGFAPLASYLWFMETQQPHPSNTFSSPLLGIHKGTAYVLLYNGILGDRRAQGGNVLTSVLWPYIQGLLPEHHGPWVIFGEAARMGEARRRAQQITFKQIPYDLKLI